MWGFFIKKIWGDQPTWPLFFVQGEEDKGEKMERLAVQLAGLADVYVNDAFGSWQAHTSTYHVTKYLPSFAGLCMQVITLSSDLLYLFIPPIV